MREEIRYLSVCSGLGGCTLAVSPLGWVAAGYAEVDPFAGAILEHRFGAHALGQDGNGPPNFGDFTTIDPAQLGPVDILIGGTPCQAFSVAGSRLSLADARGNLSLAYVVLAHELARHNGLRNALWENVPGVLSTGDNAFGCFLGAIVGADAPIEPSARPTAGKSNDFWRWRKAGIETDDEGNETEVEEGHVTRWPRFGMVAGPRGRAAWRVLDAQFFGLAQRRERVFVVADFGTGADPAAVLFERPSVQGNPRPSRKAGQGVARPLAAGSRGSGGYRHDADTADRLIAAEVASTLQAAGGRRNGAPNDHDPAGGLVAESVYLGNAEGGAPDVPFVTASCLGKHVNNQTPLVGEPVAVDLRNSTLNGDTTIPVQAGGMGDERGRCINVLPHVVEPVVEAYVHPRVLRNSQSSNQVGIKPGAEISDALTSEGPGAVAISEQVAFDTTQITHAANRSNPQPGDPCHPLAAGAHAPAIAFAQNTRDEVRLQGDGDISGTLSAESGSHQTTFIAQPVAFNIYPASGQGSALEASPTDVANAVGAVQNGAMTERGTRIVEPVAFSCKDYGADATNDLSPTLRAMGHSEGVAFNGGGQVAVAFQTRGSNLDVGDISGTLGTNADRASGGAPMVAQPVAFKASHYTRDKDGAPSEISPPLSDDADKGDQDPLVLAPVAQEFAFDLRGRDGGAMPEGPHDTANIRAASGGSSRSYVAQQTRDEHGRNAQGDAAPTLRTLRDEIGAEAFAEWGLGILDSLQPAEVLRPDVHGGGVRREAGQAGSLMGNGAPSRPQAGSPGALFGMREAGRERRPPPGWEPSEQRSAELGQALSLLSQQGASAQRFLHGLWQAAEGLRVLREALPAVQEVRRPAHDQDQPAYTRWAVRRLTPQECEKLQGIPVGHTQIPWRGKPASECPDGPRYRALGNSWARPVVAWICSRIDADLRKENP